MEAIREAYAAQWQRIKEGVEKKRGFPLLIGPRRKPMTDKQFEAAMGLIPAERELPPPVVREEVSAPPKPQPRPQMPPPTTPQTSGLRSYL